MKAIYGRKFEVIVAGDIIEHVYNQGLFLSSIREFCNDRTEVLITTPNCFSTHYFWPFFLSKRDICREDHTCWHSDKTLKQIIEFHGFKVTEMYFSNEQVVNGIRPFFRVMAKKLFPHTAHGLICVAKMESS